MQLVKLAEGVAIMMKYMTMDDPGCVQAEHDQIWLGPCDDEILFSKADVARLEELGFFWDEESWSCFA